MSDPLRTIERQQRRDIRLLYTVMADAIESAATRQKRQKASGAPITEADRSAIMREVDDALAAIWGRFRGDPDAEKRRIGLREAHAAQLVPLDDAVKRLRKVLPRSVMQRIEAEAR